MKKALALVLAVMTVLSLSLTAFAEDTASLSVREDDNGVKVGDLLLPGKEYRFPLAITIGSSTEMLSSTHLKTYKVSVKYSYGSSDVATAKIFNDDGQQYLSIATKASDEAKVKEAVFELKLTKGGETVWSEDLKLSVGFASVSDEAVEAVDGDYSIEVAPSAPVITTKQFERIHELIGNEPLTMYHGDWKFEARVPYQETVNLYYNKNRISAIVKQFGDQELQFFNFTANPKFDATGTFTIDVEHDVEAYDGKFFLYRYENGKLLNQNAKFDENEQTVSFKTSQLGTFVLTNKEIPHGTLVENVGSGSGSSSEKNPATGANHFVGAAVAAAALSLAAAVAVRKMKK